MRKRHIGLLLFAVCGSLISHSLLMTDQASALSGTGLGISKHGPLEAHMGDTITYSIIVYNLGDYWIRNITVMDNFPNGTSSSWSIPDLAPQGQPGDSFNVSGLVYTVQFSDGPVGDYTVNYAAAIGYSDIPSLRQSLFVRAETNWPTFILGPAPYPVGGFSTSIRTTRSTTPAAIHFSLLLIVCVIFLIFRRRSFPPTRKTTS